MTNISNNDSNNNHIALERKIKKNTCEEPIPNNGREPIAGGASRHALCDRAPHAFIDFIDFIDLLGDMALIASMAGTIFALASLTAVTAA